MKFEQKHILDELLVMRTQNGDMQAFSLLVKRWQPALLSQAHRLTRDDEASLDIAQETWRAIANGIYRLKSPSAFKTWSFRIVSNKSVNWIREQQKQRQILEGNNVDLIAQDEPGNDSENIELIKKALNELPIKSKTILSMFYVDEHSVKEIAKILSLSEGTVKSRLFYARKALKERFEKFKH
jgi:RNA polymerase sigma-70 factor (ECF subfamily)